MLYINEFLPAPTKYQPGEFVELYNSGAAPVNLSGYKLGTTAKKKFELSGYSINAQGYLVLYASSTKLALKNSDGVLFLYDPDGRIVDQAGFMGVAPKGKSFSRVDYNNEPTQHFIFADPTPGAANVTTSQTLHPNNYPFATSLSPQLSIFSIIEMMVGTGVIMLSLFTYIIFKNGILSNIIFGRDQTTRQRVRATSDESFKDRRSA